MFGFSVEKNVDVTVNLHTGESTGIAFAAAVFTANNNNKDFRVLSDDKKLKLTGFIIECDLKQLGHFNKDTNERIELWSADRW